jgi:hypothetical protein
MAFQSEFYRHILTGRAGDAGPFLARVALNLGYDAKSFPVDLKDIVKTGHFIRTPEFCAVSEFFLAEFLRMAIMEKVEPWREDQVQRLKIFASSPIPSTQIFDIVSQIKMNS